jgi:hypothetical protein
VVLYGSLILYVRCTCGLLALGYDIWSHRLDRSLTKIQGTGSTFPVFRGFSILWQMDPHSTQFPQGELVANRTILWW